jgi:ornithine cyclodeaminase
MLRGDDIAGLVSIEEAVESQRAGFAALATGEAGLAPRVLLPGADSSTSFSYVARMSDRSAAVTKFGSVVPANASRGRPTVSAIVVALDPGTGRPAAIIDGEAVTALRTVAASALVASTLAPDTRRLAVIGWGRQGRRHAEVLSAGLSPDEVRVFDPYVTAYGLESVDLTGTVSIAHSVAEAVAGADLVVTCTTSTEPVVELSWLAPGATVLSVGSFAPDRREVGDDIVTAARVVVDHRDTALVQAGPIVHALAAGMLEHDRIEEIGAVLTGTVLSGTGSSSPGGVTYYNSVGVGIQDAAIVELLLERAIRSGAGTWVPW